MSCLPGPRNSLDIITTKYKLLFSCCCLVLFHKAEFLSSETTHFIPKKKTVYRSSFSHNFRMIDSSAGNKTLENASAFTRSFPSKAEGIVLCSAFILSSVLIIAGNLLTLVLFAVTKPLRRKSFFSYEHGVCWFDVRNLHSALLIFSLLEVTISFGQQNMTLNKWSTEYFIQVSITYFCLAHIYLQPLFLVRDSMPYFGRLNTVHYPPEHTAPPFSDSFQWDIGLKMKYLYASNDLSFTGIII